MQNIISLQLIKKKKKEKKMYSLNANLLSHEFWISLCVDSSQVHISFQYN